MASVGIACTLAALGLALATTVSADEAAAQLLARVNQYELSALPPHPRLLLSDANIARLRQTLTTPARRQQWQRIMEWLALENSQPLPADPGPRRSYYTGPGGTIDIARFRAMSELSGAIENHIVVAAAAYRLTGDPKTLELARSWALAVAKWNPQGATGIRADDFAARQLLYSLALAYDGLFAQWTPDERRVIRDSMLKRAADIHAHLYPFKLDEYNNHPWFQCSALVDAGLALADESTDADRWWRYGAEVYFTRFLPLWGRDGDWHEGFSYFTFTMKYVAQFANSLQSATGINPFDLPSLRRAGWFRLYAAPAGSSGIYFNDTWPRARLGGEEPTAFRLAAEAHEPALQWYAEQWPRVEDPSPSVALYLLLYQDPVLRPEPPAADVPLTRFFRDSGWVIARSDLTSGKGVEFGFKSTPWTATSRRLKGHDHPDVNSFLLNYLGQPLLVDSGFYDYYSSPHHKGWTFAGRAHNTLLIDGQEQLLQRPGRILSFESRAGQFDWMEGEGAESYPAGLLQGWRRQVCYLRPDIFVIRDVVRPAAPAVITLLLHGTAQFELDGQAFVCRNGTAMVTGRIATPEHLQIKQWTGFPAGMEPERKQPSDFQEFPDQGHLECSTADKVGDITFITVFSPSAAAQPRNVTASVASKDGEDVVTVQLGGRAPVTVVLQRVPRDGTPTPPPIVPR